MNETQDTIDGLLAELREHAAGVLTSGYVTMSGRDFHKMLDRFDAAYKREKAAIEADALAVGGIVGASHEREKATAEKSSAVGDCAKLREALGDLRAELWNNTVIAGKRKFELYEIADAALAAPPRNCDVGTAEEQAERFYNFCTEYSNAIRGMCDYKCPCLDSGDKCHCLCKWAQMPYKEGGNDDK